MILTQIGRAPLFLLMAVSLCSSESAYAEDLKVACKVYENRIAADCSRPYLQSWFEFKIVDKDGFDMGKMDSTLDPEFHFEASYMANAKAGISNLRAQVKEIHTFPETPQNPFPYLGHSSTADRDGVKLYDSVLVDLNDIDASGDRRACVNSKSATMVCILAKASDTFAGLSEKFEARLKQK